MCRVIVACVVLIACRVLVPFVTIDKWKSQKPFCLEQYEVLDRKLARLFISSFSHVTRQIPVQLTNSQRAVFPDLVLNV